jgi:hypothetical protein
MRIPTKWADYVITAARYNPERTQITHVKLHPDDGRSLGPEDIWTRSQVIDAMRSFKSFATAFCTEGMVFRDDPVRLVEATRGPYLRVDTKPVRKDDLGRLPEFETVPEALEPDQRAG